MTPADACHEPTPAELADLFRPEELDRRRPASLLALKMSATRAAKYRGHAMRPWLSDGRVAHTECSRCGMGVTVDPRPAANGIDIGGLAVALNCQTSRV